jgi:hypothetical protein
LQQTFHRLLCDRGSEVLVELADPSGQVVLSNEAPVVLAQASNPATAMVAMAHVIVAVIEQTSNHTCQAEVLKMDVVEVALAVVALAKNTQIQDLLSERAACGTVFDDGLAWHSWVVAELAAMARGPTTLPFLNELAARNSAA